MSTTTDEDQTPETWTHADDDGDTPEVPAELALDAELHTPEEAGYGYGV